MNNYLRMIGFLVLVGLLALVATSGGLAAPPGQGPPPALTDAGLIDQLQQEAGGKVRVSYHAGTGKVRFIGADLEHPISRPAGVAAAATPEQAARQFLAGYGQLFGLGDPAEELAVMRERTADRGRSFVRFRQTYRGIPVLGGELIVQMDRDKNVVSANGEVLPDLKVNVVPTISAETARQQALEMVAGNYGLSADDLTATEPELWVYNPVLLGGPGPRLTTLVWRIDVEPAELLPVRELALVDAHRGVIALHFNQIDTAKSRLMYDNNNNPSLGLPGNGPVRTEGGAATGITDVDNAYDYAGDTYDFYSSYHGRDSLDDSGMQLVSTTRYCPDASNCPYLNAFWSGSISQMVYGDGFPQADDVVGHELTHGVTDYESSLFYYMQSGAINEAFSDIWGEFVDLTNGAGNDSAGVRWEIGEDEPNYGAMRDMSNPPAHSQPDKISHSDYYCGEQDRGGVHSNSGVANKAAYLIVDGDAFNGQTVTGLGISKAAKIFYEVQTNMFTSAADYNDLYDGLIQACANLVGSSGITAADCQEVKDAVDATEMNQQPASCLATHAPICDSGSPTDLFYDDMENTGSGNWTSAAIAGANEWYYPQNSHPYSGFDATYATSGQYNIWGNDQYGQADYYIAMTSDVTLPANAYLHFNHAYAFDDYSTKIFDGGVLEYSANGGSSWYDGGSLLTNNGYNGAIGSSWNNPLGGQSAFVRESNGYISSRAGLNSLAGQNVRFRFRIGASDTSDPQRYGAADGWFIDDVRLYTCAAGNTAPAISGLPDQTVTMNGSADNAIDLWAYTSDTEDADNELTFTIDNSPDPGAGVTIDSNRYIDINPTGGWTGQTDVVIRATDSGSLSDTDTFRVTVVGGKIWNGSLSNDWHTAANWTPSGVPTSTDDVTIPDVTNDPVISNGDAAVNNLTINAGAVLDLTTRRLTVEGALTNNGTLKQTQDVAGGSAANFLRIANLAGTQTKYYGLDITPSGASRVTAGPIAAAAAAGGESNLLVAPEPASLSGANGFQATASAAAATLFYDGFESGSLGPDWTTYTTAEGRVQVSSTYPYSGAYSVLLDDSVDNTTYSYAALILSIDLSGQSQVELDFWWREFSDENDPDDGVFISDDNGANWYQALSFNNGPSSYRNDVIDLDAAAAANGLTLNNQFQIKFQFYDNFSITTDGYAIDDVHVLVPALPDIEVSPTSFEETLAVGGRVTKTLTISNTGSASLAFQINEVAGGYTFPKIASSRKEKTVSTSPEPVPAVAPYFGFAQHKSAGANSDTLASVARAPFSAQPKREAVASNLVTASGALAYATEIQNRDLVSFATDNPGALTNIGNIGGGAYYAADFLGGDFTTMYALDNDANTFIAIDTATGVPTVIGSASPAAGHTWTGMAGDPATDTLYGASTDGSTSTLYTFDVSTGAPTVVGQITNAPIIIGIAVNTLGEMYGLDIGGDVLVSINKATGAGTVIGLVGFDANYAQGMDFDEADDTLYLAAYNGDTSRAELRIADTSTGNSALSGSFPSATEIDALSIAGGDPADNVPWLSETPTGDAVPATNSLPVDVIFNAAGLASGSYTATLVINSNDPDENPLTVPVVMHVTGAANTPPTLSGLPDQTAPMNGSVQLPLDLWAYANDAESPDNELTFTIDNTPDPNAGVSLDANRYININPALDWTGQTTVTIRVADPGGLFDTDSFLVTVTASISPDIEVSPTAFDETVLMDNIVTKTLTVSNTGPGPLTFQIGEDYASWLSQKPISGTVPANDSLPVAVIFDAAGLALGSYPANLIINNNDPDEDPVVVPVVMEVTDTANTPPTLSGLPDQTAPMNGSADNAIDLWSYANDAEDTDADLTFTITNSPAVSAGVTIDVNRYIDINPAAGWAGVTSVEVQVQDTGGLTGTDTFQVTVGVTTTSVTVSVSGNQFCGGRTTGVKRCFDITSAAPITATARFYFAEAERNGQTLNNLLVFHYNGSWTEEPGPYARGGAGDAQYVEAQNVDHFSLFALDGVSSGPTTNLVYLPLVMKRWPPIPDTPALNAINNSDGDGYYSVSWNVALLASTYTLEEDDNPAFSSPTTQYTGSGTSWTAGGKATGTYYYRVKASNSWGDSGWSNTQPVSVQPPPSGPTPGFWEGTGVELYVTPDRAYVDDFAIFISVQGCGNIKIIHSSAVPISNDQFSFSGSFYASGTFNSATTASGTTGLDNYYIPTCGYITGGPFSWSAVWKDSSQPISMPVEGIGYEVLEFVTTTGSVYTATLVKGQ